MFRTWHPVSIRCKAHVWVSDICALPKEVGPCSAFQPRWYFDHSYGRCVQFNYGGCGANDNNFYTEEDCRLTCGGQETLPEQETGGGHYLKTKLVIIIQRFCLVQFHSVLASRSVCPCTVASFKISTVCLNKLVIALMLFAPSKVGNRKKF